MTEKSVVDIPIGSVVLANAGRDKGRYFVAVAASGGFVYIADGKERKLEKPKRKNIKHISPADVIISTDELTNRKLRNLGNTVFSCPHGHPGDAGSDPVSHGRESVGGADPVF